MYYYIYIQFKGLRLCREVCPLLQGDIINIRRLFPPPYTHTQVKFLVNPNPNLRTYSAFVPSVLLPVSGQSFFFVLFIQIIIFNTYSNVSTQR